jgi:hypothetical protein
MRGARSLIIALVFSLVMPVTAFGNGISCLDQATLRSTAAGRPAIITFVNNSRHAANIYWIDYAGKRAQHFYVTPGSVISRNTLVTHPWVITDDHDNCLGVAFANPSTPNVEITDSAVVLSRTSGPALADNPAGGDEAGGPQAIQAMNHDEAGTVTYRGQLKGLENFSLKIGPAHEGKSWVAGYVGVPGHCLGDIAGQATVRGDVLELTKDDGGNDCRLTIHRSATGATIAEINCVSGHGPSCSFDTQGKRLHQVSVAKAPAAAAAVPAQKTSGSKWTFALPDPGHGLPRLLIRAPMMAGHANLSFWCQRSPRADELTFEPAVYDPDTGEGEKARFLLEIQDASGAVRTFPIVAYNTGPDGGSQFHSRNFLSTSLLDTLRQEDGVLRWRTDKGVEIASWPLSGVADARAAARKFCGL